MTYEPAIEVPVEVLAWLRAQSQSAYCRDRLRFIERYGGLRQRQLDYVTRLSKKK